MRYVSIAERVAGQGLVKVDIKDNCGQTVGWGSHTDGAPKVVLSGGITPDEADRLVGCIRPNLLLSSGVLNMLDCWVLMQCSVHGRPAWPRVRR